jgi:hypothetical protein
MCPLAVVLQYAKNTKYHIHTLKTIHNTQNYKHNNTKLQHSAYKIANIMSQPNKEPKIVNAWHFQGAIN